MWKKYFFNNYNKKMTNPSNKQTKVKTEIPLDEKIRVAHQVLWVICAYLVFVAVGILMVQGPTPRVATPQIWYPQEGIQIYNGNHHYLAYNGQPILLFGTGTWTTASMLINGAPYDYQSENLWLSRYGSNFNRVGPFWPGSWDNEDRILPFNRIGEGYCGTGPDCALDEGYKFNLQDFNEAYWDTLDGYLNNLESKDIIVLFQLFDEPGIEEGGGDRWKYNPFNNANNTQDLDRLNTVDATYGDAGNDGFIGTFYDVGNQNLLDFQRLYFFELMDHLSERNNIVYELVNEYAGELSDQPPGHWDWVEYILDLFDEYRSDHPRFNPFIITNMPMGENYNWGLDNGDEYIGDSRIKTMDIYKQSNTRHSGSSYKLDWLNDQFTYFYNNGQRVLPLISGRVGPLPDNNQPPNWPLDEEIKKGRMNFWTIYVSGGVGGTFKLSFAGDFPNGYPCESNPPQEGHYYECDLNVENLIYNLHMFADRTKFWKMAPDNSVLSNYSSGIDYAFALVNPGEEIVVYLVDEADSTPSGNITVNVSKANTKFIYRIYSGLTGTFDASNNGIALTSGTDEKITINYPAFNEDTVIYIKKAEVNVSSTPDQTTFLPGETLLGTDSVTNHTTDYQTKDYWSEIIGPTGQSIEVNKNLAFDLAPDETSNRNFNYDIPGLTPAGYYTYVAKVGDYENQIVEDQNFFRFVVE